MVPCSLRSDLQCSNTSVDVATESQREYLASSPATTAASIPSVVSTATAATTTSPSSSTSTTLLLLLLLLLRLLLGHKGNLHLHTLGWFKSSTFHCLGSCSNSLLSRRSNSSCRSTLGWLLLLLLLFGNSSQDTSLCTNLGFNIGKLGTTRTSSSSTTTSLSPLSSGSILTPSLSSSTGSSSLTLHLFFDLHGIGFFVGCKSTAGCEIGSSTGLVFACSTSSGIILFGSCSGSAVATSFDHVV
mmetsp:Transcript_16834/g.28492  ORF Transcript_16834/g.28492 Transcript_16834/m.28492 type:complete len:243 (+) Transcript_16834:1004-1732(+)